MRITRLLRCVAVTGIILFAIGFALSRSAYAESQNDGYEGDFSNSPYEVVYGPTVVGSAGNKVVQCYATSKYDAALLALGYSLDDSTINDESKAYLSNSTTGGAFYAFAETFTNNNDVLDNMTYSVATALAWNNTLYGAQNVWMATYTDNVANGALQSILDVLSGNVSGGGSGGSGGETNEHVYTFDLENYVRVYSGGSQEGYITVGGVRYNLYDSGGVQSNFPSGNKITVTLGSSYNSLDLTDYSDAYICMKPVNGYMYIDFYLLKPNTYTLSMDHTDNRLYTITLNGGDSYYWFQKSRVSLTYGSMPFDTTYTIESNLNYMTSGTEHVGFLPGLFAKASVAGPPPTNWPEPDPPTTTDPPEVPEPEPPTGTTQPDVSIQFPSITFPSITLSPDFTWVTADIDAILRALNSHCQHLQQAIHNGFDDFFENWEIVVNRNTGRVIQAIQTNFEWIWDNVNDEFDYLYDYLYDLFHWLARQFDFNVDPYNDNNVISWLRKIYSKLGQGPVNTRPVDPVADPFNFADWLNQLMQNFVIGLLSLGHDVLANLTEAARQLITKFPFSIPWDIAAIIAALAAEPVTPVVVVPAYTVTGSGLTQAGTYRIDLADYDNVMVGVRAMETVVFGFYLMFKTDFFLGIMKLSGGKE